ncbi:family 2 glycosyl transferase [Natrinema pallidum DSM 3751]|uniref:Family 2 glycosyl transferase n=1 Tax=Natrinema pallidum DSM 3751 TaxID=1227495 RepID=L9YZ39_9EURY|nr:family 2 glycosyl transferase [Natrinema pallidum DSM 3751]
MLRDFLWRLRAKFLVLDFHPLALMYCVGTGLAATGILAVVVMLFATLSTLGRSRQGSTILRLPVAGVAFLLFAMVFDMAESEAIKKQVQ